MADQGTQGSACLDPQHWVTIPTCGLLLLFFGWRLNSRFHIQVASTFPTAVPSQTQHLFVYEPWRERLIVVGMYQFMTRYFTISFKCFYVCDNSACMCASALKACVVPTEAEVSVGSPGTEVMDSCKLPCGYWNSNLGPLHEHFLFNWGIFSSAFEYLKIYWDLTKNILNRATTSSNVLYIYKRSRLKILKENILQLVSQNTSKN